MKPINYLLIILLLLFFNGCEENSAPYQDTANRLNFVYESYTKDSTTRYTFVYDPASKIVDTIWVEISTMGYITDYDRPIALVQIPTETNSAEPGVHYLEFDNQEISKYYLIPSGKNYAKVPIVVLRDPSLKNTEVQLKLGFAPNAHFQQGYKRVGEKLITISDILTQPKYWDTYAEYYITGPYGKVKHQFMMDVTAHLGIKINDDFFFPITGDPYNVDMGLTDYWKGFFHYELERVNAERKAQGLGPLREEPEAGQEEGTLVTFE